jgi:hypothetical protein
MEIKIDTEKDSKDTIKKVIKLLESFIEYDYTNKYRNNDTNYSKERYDKYQREESETQREDYAPPSEGLFGIFDTDNKDEETKTEPKEDERKEKQEDKIDIIPY